MLASVTSKKVKTADQLANPNNLLMNWARVLSPIAARGMVEEELHNISKVKNISMTIQWEDCPLFLEFNEGFFEMRSYNMNMNDKYHEGTRYFQYI